MTWFYLTYIISAFFLFVSVNDHGDIFFPFSCRTLMRMDSQTIRTLHLRSRFSRAQVLVAYSASRRARVPHYLRSWLQALITILFMCAFSCGRAGSSSTRDYETLKKPKTNDAGETSRSWREYAPWLPDRSAQIERYVSQSHRN